MDKKAYTAVEKIIHPERFEKQDALVQESENFYGMMTYASFLDNTVAFYDDKNMFDQEVAYQKSVGPQNYGTVLTKEQFISEIAKALETSGHYISIGNKLNGDYTEEVAKWREDHPVDINIYPEMMELTQKVTAVYNWEQVNDIPEAERATNADGHTGQIFILSEEKLEERYNQINDIEN